MQCSTSDVESGVFYYTTESYHSDNFHTMCDFVSNRLDKDAFDIEFVEGTFGEITCRRSGQRFEVHASGNGDSFNHKIDFELIEQQA